MKEMKATIVWTIAALVALTPVFAQKPDETTISRLLEEIREAQRTGDLDYLAEVMHPNALASIRRSASIDLDNLEKRYSETEVERLLGFPRRDLLLLSDAKFFIYTVGLVMDFHLESRPESEPGGTVFLGIVPDGDIHYAFYRVQHIVESESDRVDLRQPLLLAFRQSNGEWKVHSMMYANLIAPVFQREILRKRRLVERESGEDGNGGHQGADEPAR